MERRGSFAVLSPAARPWSGLGLPLVALLFFLTVTQFAQAAGRQLCLRRTCRFLRRGSQGTTLRRSELRDLVVRGVFPQTTAQLRVRQRLFRGGGRVRRRDGWRV